VRDQAELFGFLLKLYNLNFTLIAVQPLANAAQWGLVQPEIAKTAGVCAYDRIDDCIF